MRISFLCSDKLHPVNEHLCCWIGQQQDKHQIELVRKKSELSGGDILFLISCSEIVGAAERAAYRASLVLHASDLPSGRGWSPHIWQIIAGAEEITLSLLEAEDRVDSGRIWKKLKFPVPQHALWSEINERLFDAEIELIDFAVSEFDNIVPVEQDPNIEPTYYPRRSPTDSQLDPTQSIVNQFDRIRVCDPNRFPAFFELHGKKYKITLEKISD
ncbi:formyltransferase family protein [Pseudomonas benzenivorans]|uniref:UDP-glucuronic acid dehydrogenase n=1 Tax=Pseudomonas benzenivorans TaxID=556533 RepID=A0ABY5H7W3_9PSED|nr:formyltransferase family protein [Pseudomonas benzenivorans]UTW07487.1 UDP-glucuronic acid dehydrogenase [Pseudomonas benzenivorans]